MATLRIKSVPENSGSKPLSQRVLSRHFRALALLIALHCVRNTIIENYHAVGRLTDPEIAALNREVVNKIYAFLQIMLNPRYEAVRPTVFAWLYALRAGINRALTNRSCSW
jgi:hypothetical protein